MEKVKVKLENCYGIKSFEHEFDFTSDCRANFIYAPNGVMKTSFATTFEDYSEGRDSLDRVHPLRPNIREIVDENGVPLSAESVFVIEPYQADYKSQKISTLLVNRILKERYDQIYADIDTKKADLINALKINSDLKSGIEEEIAEAFVYDKKEFFKAILRIKDEVAAYKPTQLDTIIYQKVFNDKFKAILESPDFKSSISNYIDTYDKLISNSNFFRRGVFNHNNASETAKSLKDNGFFKANHSIYISSVGKKIEVKTEAELEALIQTEKDAILNNQELAKQFDKIDRVLTKNKDTRDLRDYIFANKVLINELDNLGKLRQKLWIAYLANHKSHYEVLVEAYNIGSKEIDEIVKQATIEATEWQNVIKVFNDRFNVPFEVRMDNQEDVILRREAPSISFHFTEDKQSQGVRISEQELLKILSNGERRALYILNIIFEVEARKKAGQETLFVIDDIADSFDYKNKYAIIEYLRDVANESIFCQLILTHNFDFFRTITSRLHSPRSNRWHTIKTIDSIKLKEEKYQNNPFSHWKEHLDDPQMMIAAIPFVRNLADYCGYNQEFEDLTSLLHLRNSTKTITIANLQQIFQEVLKDQTSLSIPNQTKLVLDEIYEQAENIFVDTDEIIELEQKIVLSMAIRLYSEEYMIGQINNSTWVSSITSNQTAKLVKKFKLLFPTEHDQIDTLEQVQIMTPDNIHINSFMYEPILDMSNLHLKALYDKVKSL